MSKICEATWAWRHRRLREVYPDADKEGLRRLADELGVSISTVMNMAHRAGLHRAPRPVKNTYRRVSKTDTPYSPEVVASLLADYPDHTNAELSARYGMSKAVIVQLALTHGVRKSDEHRSRVGREASRKRGRGMTNYEL